MLEEQGVQEVVENDTRTTPRCTAMPSTVCKDTSRCSVCNLEKAVFTDRSSGTRICQHCYDREARGDWVHDRGCWSVTTCTVSLRTAIILVKIREMVIPRWKRWRLRNPEKDREQRMAYYCRNLDEIVANSRVRYRVKKGANAGDLNEQGRGEVG
ncbi:MAG: hypothetical protein WCK53_03065 [Methanomicrobiales archaeon]